MYPQMYHVKQAHDIYPPVQQKLCSNSSESVVSHLSLTYCLDTFPRLSISWTVSGIFGIAVSKACRIKKAPERCRTQQCQGNHAAYNHQWMMLLKSV